MAILKNLIVNGSARFLNTLYANDLNITNATVNNLTVTGITNIAAGSATSASLQINNKGALYGYDSWLRINEQKQFSSGVYFGSNIVRTDGSFQIGSAGANILMNTSGATFKVPININGTTYKWTTDGNIVANRITASSSIINNLYVPNELRAVNYNIETVSHLGGAFFVAPSIEVPAGNNVSITAISGNTITATISDNSITTTAFSPTWWCANSLVKIAGSIAGIPIGTCNGTLTSALVAGRVVVQFTYTGQSEKPLSVANSQASSGLSVTLTTISGTKPIGIYMTALGQNNWADSTALNKTAISIYGGTTDGAIPDSTNPVVRIGNLAGLPSVNNEQPVGWGIYTNHGYFSGLIVSNSGKIGNFTISDALYSTAKAFGTTANNVYIGDDGISLGTTFKVTKAGELTATSGSIGGWTIGTSDIHSGTHSAWNTASDGLFLGTTKIAGGNGGTWYLNNDGTGKIGRFTFSSGGEFTTTVSSNTAGMGNGTYAFWAGATSANAANAPFRVTYAGALSATSGSIGGSVTIGGTAASTILSNITNAATTATNYLTQISGTTGISVHDSGDTSNFVNMNSDGVFVYKGGTQKAKFADTVTIGKPYVNGATDNESYMELDNQSLQLIDMDGNTYFHVQDLRDSDGEFEYTETFSTDGVTSTFQLAFTATDDNYTITYGGPGTISSKTIYQFIFSSAPPAGYSITVNYHSTSDQAKGYTFGKFKEGERIGAYSVREGFETVANGSYSHAEGYRTKSDSFCHSEGYMSKAIGYNSHAEGHGTTASGALCHAEGYYTEAIGDNSHAEGNYTEAIGDNSHAEGIGSSAHANDSHAEGNSTNAYGECSHAEGYVTTANGDYSHTQNNYSVANSRSQTVIGEYNDIDTTGTASTRGTYSFIIGNGVDVINRSNALTVDWDGNLVCNNVGVPNYMTNPTITKSTGSSTCSVVAFSGYGKTRMLVLAFTTTAAISSGSNVFTGTITTTNARPKIAAGGSGFAGGTAVIGNINASGGITIRACGGSLSSNSTIWVYFTYYVV